MIDAVSVVISIFLLIGTGMLLTRFHWIDESGARLLARLTVNVGLCALIVNNMLSEFTRELLIESAGGIAACYLSMALTIAAGILTARIARIEERRRGAFVCMFAFSNAVFIGLPVAVALFGQQATPYALIYYVANTSLFWSVGNFLMARDGGQKGALELKKLLPLPLVVFLISVVLILAGVTLPAFLMKATGYLGNMVTPISLIYTGYVIMGMIEKGALRWRKGYGLMLLGRFLLSPVLLLFVSTFVPLAGAEVRDVLLIQAAMPVMTQTTILAGDRGADVEYVAGGLLLSTLMSLAVIPGLMGLIPYL